MVSPRLEGQTTSIGAQAGTKGFTVKMRGDGVCSIAQGSAVDAQESARSDPTMTVYPRSHVTRGASLHPVRCSQQTCTGSHTIPD